VARIAAWFYQNLVLFARNFHVIDDRNAEFAEFALGGYQLAGDIHVDAVRHVYGHLAYS
jgi:hypothetical protein